MKVYRYMSKKEFQLMGTGCDIYPQRKLHGCCRTTSEGICFLPEKVTIVSDGYDDEKDPVWCIQFLEGIVTNDILVEFEAPTGFFQETVGIYANPCSIGLCGASELCCNMYNRELLQPVRYALVSDWNKADWYPYR